MLTLSGRALLARGLVIRCGNYWIYSHGIHSRERDYSVYFKELGLENNCDQGTVRDAFIKLAKKYHPDSGHVQADAVKFQQIDQAYRKLQEKFSDDRRNHNNCEGEYGLYYEQKRKTPETEDDEEDHDKIFDIKHTAPQHRQYLSYEGIGVGTPSQREKQYTRYQALRASTNVTDYKIQKITSQYPETSLVDKDRAFAKKIRTRYGIDRIVDDMIQEAMAKGEFDNLPNAGKPLPQQNCNPYVDTVTHKLNQVLINNGYAPEWVMLEKEIREDRMYLRKMLRKKRERLGALPLTPQEEVLWKKSQEQLQDNIKAMNKKIDKYNFVVPLLAKQMTHFPLRIEAEKALQEGLSRDQIAEKEVKEVSPEKRGFLSGFKLFGMFKNG
nr:dnaJ homolog subfamily C member 28-like [Procambarus clarkii]XP_045596695.1 dnaJ homolog subfamily C member 28-like [Procambarus clarkii]XP_045596696.1 dnaJ homolog subfamily C member 28-like [Procambarus clarkii]XP_045596697.1 dnaJ homolog subfamily C member 28-like [Procambarus clarkii]XP_045596698.1 dnaJ homolog subfamily C member 28-like [Procambarus clarkii]XP_045596699.1 dnaJ homolog subfamily C member 28-like [Procambarus clarkii]XP_045596700.1 dnaJ homolog subfamily C member 28-lik